MEVHAMSDDGHPDDIELPDGPLRLLAASNELDALQRMLRGDANNAVAALKAMDYAELYCLRASDWRRCDERSASRAVSVPPVHRLVVDAQAA